MSVRKIFKCIFGESFVLQCTLGFVEFSSISIFCIKSPNIQESFACSYFIHALPWTVKDSLLCFCSFQVLTHLIFVHLNAGHLLNLFSPYSQIIKKKLLFQYFVYWNENCLKCICRMFPGLLLYLYPNCCPLLSSLIVHVVFLYPHPY